MEVRPGYRRTEVGVVPKDWEVASLGEKTTKVGSGITPTGGSKVYKKEGRPFLRSQNVGWGNLLLDDVAFIDDRTHETFRTTEVETDDVFLNITGASIGRSAVADDRVTGGNVNQHVCIIRTHHDQLLPRFLNLFLLSSAGQKQIDSFQAGGNRQGLNFGQIRSMQIPLPPLPEQRAIAAALSDVDALIAALDRLIAKKRAIKQGAIQQLLTGQTRLPGFSGPWEVKKIGDIAPLQRGFDLPTSQLEKGVYPVVYSNGIQNYHSTPKAKAPGVVTGRSGTIGNVTYVEQDYWPHNTSLWVTDFKGNAPKFIYYLYTFVGLERFGTGSGVPTLNRNDVHAHEVSIPPSNGEQQAIVAILSDMDAEIAAQEARRAKTRALKQGMMQELLTGKTRLV
jgi:type I restriction enzyme S subunit